MFTLVSCIVPFVEPEMRANICLLEAPHELPIVETPEQHKEALKEDAEKRIHEMINEGYHQGELNTSIRFGKEIVEQEDAEDGLTYSGWWSAQKKIK